MIEIDYTDFDATVSFLQNKYNNLNTYCNKISEILNIIRTQENRSLQILYRTELARCKSLLLDKPKKPFDSFLQLENLRNIWSQRNIIDRHGLITGLYLFIPALRSDYAGSVIKNNQISLSLVKVNKGSIITKQVPPELNAYIALWSTLPTSHKTFANLLSTSSKVVFDRSISINVFRRVWTEFGLRTMTISEQKQLATDMNHSFEIHNTTYTPLMQPVYF
jgi:hypothetical protein